jgi:hypothetical protein
VHLARKTHAPNIFSAKLGIPQNFTNRDATCPPPIFRMLLGPANLRRRKGLVFFRSRRRHGSTLVNYERSRTAGSDVYAK